MTLWDAQSIQFVWFLTTVEGVRVDTLFEAITGTEPDAVQRNKVPSPVNPFLGIASGVTGAYQTVVQLQPGRLDIIAHCDEPNDNEAFPVINTKQVIDSLYLSIRSIESILPEAVRLALVCNLVKPVGTAEEGRDTIAKLLSLDPSLSDFSDLMFQINRRKRLEAGVDINRLMRWNSIALQRIILNMPGHQNMVAPAVHEKHAAALSLDINTVVETRVFSGAQQIPIFEGMIAEAKRIGELAVPSALMD